MECDKCDYMLEAFDEQCPRCHARCHGRGLPKKPRRKYASVLDSGEKLLILWFFASIIFLIVECDPLDNTLGGIELTFAALALGIAASIVATGFLYAFSIESTKTTRPLWMFGVLLPIFTMTSIAVASSVNRNLSSPIEYQSKYKMVSKGFSYTKSRQYYLSFMTAYGKERVIVTQRFYEATPVGGTLLLTLRVGFFGYPVITKIDQESPSTSLLPKAYNLGHSSSLPPNHVSR